MGHVAMCAAASCYLAAVHAELPHDYQRVSQCPLLEGNCQGMTDGGLQEA